MALMVPSNGVGLGHVSRLLAISRRLSGRIEPVFCSLAQVAPVIEGFGYRAEYIPSQGDTCAEPEAWDDWFGYQLEEAMDLYGPSVVVFDGNIPSPGLMRAVLSRGGTKLVWVRRAMFTMAAAPFLEMARFMDLVIEPGEIAADRDTGPSVARRGEALQVDPITLLDRDEVLPRDAARRDLGLAPDAPAVLVQLGAGASRNLAALIGAVMEELAPFVDLQIVLAEWENSAVQPRGWPRARLLRGFPLSRYFRAFDFSVSAAGYNTFHEVTAAGLPTIFLANRHPMMDNQGARAAFAQDNGMAFDLPEDQLSHFPALVQALMKEEVRGYMRAQSEALVRGNGAQAAAAAIIELAGRT